MNPTADHPRLHDVARSAGDVVLRLGTAILKGQARPVAPAALTWPRTPSRDLQEYAEKHRSSMIYIVDKSLMTCLADRVHTRLRFVDESAVRYVRSVERRYEWTRYVYPLGHWFQSETKRGIRGPVKPRPGVVPDGLWELSELRLLPVTAVLGERGAGKSDVLRVEHARLEDEGVPVCPIIDVSRLEDGQALRAALDKAGAWVRGRPPAQLNAATTVHVLVDGLDELLVHSERATVILARGVKDLRSIEGVDVRVILACRTPLWSLYDAQLASHGVDGVSAVVVAPLNLEDVALAAQLDGHDPARFLAQLSERGLVPLVRYPGMLITVLQAVGTNSSVPTSVVEIYEQAMHEQCIPDPEALHAGRASDAAVALNAASLIAGYERLSGHGGFSLAQSLKPTPHGDILPAGKLLSLALPNAAGVELTRPLIVQVAESGVYRGESGQVFRPAHGSYSDFLAARFLDRLAGLPVARILELLLGPEVDGRRRVWPTLAEVTGHLASMRMEVRDELLTRDPRALLHCDLHAWTDSDRARLVDALLAAASPFDDYTADESLLGRVTHSGLAGQLRPVLEERAFPPVVDLALALATACHPVGLSSALIDLVADTSVPLGARVRATAALPGLIVNGDATKLLSVARTAHGSADEKDLCFAILDALWPDSITATDLVPLLPASGSTAAQQRVLRHTLPIASSDDQISDLLDWAAAFAGSPHDEVRRSAALVLTRAARLVPVDQHVSAKLADVMIGNGLPALGEWQPLSETVQGNDSLRHAVITAMIGVDPVRTPELLRRRSALRNPGDITWLLLQVATAEATNRASWIDTLLAVADATDPATRLDLDQTAARVPDLAQRLSAIDAASQASAPARLQAAASDLTVDLTERLTELMDAFETSPGRAWPQALGILNETQFALAASQSGAEAVIPFGWTVHSRALRGVAPSVAERVIGAATDFLSAADPSTVSIAPLTNATPTVEERYNYSDDATAGRCAFELLAELPVDSLDALSAADWMTWTTPLLHLQADGAQQQKAYSRLVARAYEASAADFVDMAVAQLRVQNTVFATQAAFLVMSDCWTRGDLADQLAHRATQLVDEPVLTETILRGLMTHVGNEAAYETAAAALTAVDIHGEPTPVAIGSAIALLLEYRQPFETSPVWEALLTNPRLYRRVLELSVDPGRPGWEDALSSAPSAVLPELYRKASTLFPPASDPQFSLAGNSHERYRIAHLRDQALREIAYRADPGSFAVLRDLADVENRPAVFTPLLRIAYNAATSGWEPPSIEHLGELVRDPERRRLIHDSAGLLLLILESLKNFQSHLQGPRALVHLLWNETEAVTSPKPEVSLSDLAAWFLDLSLGGHRVVINREVQISRKAKDGFPDSVDLQIEASDQQHNGVNACVIVEVKSGWNKDLMVSLRTQLHDEYLANEPNAVGLYLVGYYLCPAWQTPEDKLTKHQKHKNIDDLRRRLEEQAVSLTRTPAVFVLDASLKTKPSAAAAAGSAAKKTSSPIKPRKSPTQRARKSQGSK